MKRIPIILLLLIIVGFACALIFYYISNSTNLPLSTTDQLNTREEIIPNAHQDSPEDILIIAQNLDTPWAIAFINKDELLITERAGSVKKINTDGQITQIAKLAKVTEIGEGGLMGIALHPQFKDNYYIYLYYTYSGSGSNTLNRVVRMTYTNNSLTDETIIVDQIPGALNHNGGRIKFGPDNFLYITTGDAQEPSLAQNKNSLAGKILRVTDSGIAAKGNPFNNRVYSYGHRNPQGLVWLPDRKMIATEHGPSGGQYGTGQDELNLITIGQNYGWPEIIGDSVKTGMEKPFLHSGTQTWAPGGAAFYVYPDNHVSVFYAGLRGEALYEMELGKDYKNIKTHFKNEYGRIREVVSGPDNLLYITTSNRDGRGNPKNGDDKLIRINPTKLL